LLIHGKDVEEAEGEAEAVLEDPEDEVSDA
jgi:hypothetical protein